MRNRCVAMHGCSEAHLQFVQRIQHHGVTRLHVLHLSDVEHAVAVVNAVQVVQPVRDVLEGAVLPHAVNEVLQLSLWCGVGISTSNKGLASCCIDRTDTFSIRPVRIGSKM